KQIDIARPFVGRLLPGATDRRKDRANQICDAHDLTGVNTAPNVVHAVVSDRLVLRESRRYTGAKSIVGQPQGCSGFQSYYCGRFVATTIEVYVTLFGESNSVACLTG